MASNFEDISESEFAVLQVLWDRPASSIRQIAEVIYRGRATSYYPTVKKQIERLEQKGFVTRDRSLMVHLFSAAVGREELVARRLDALVEKVCGGSLAPVVTHLLSASRLTEAQRDALRALADRTQTQASKSKGKQKSKE